MTPSPTSTAAGRRGRAAAAGVFAAAMLAVALLAPAGASANTYCSGFSKLDENNKDLNQLEYTLQCFNPIKGYAIHSDQLLTAFGTEPEGVGFDGGPPRFSGFSFSCEGELPGRDVVCNGAGAGDQDRINSTLSTAGSPCDLKSLTLYVVDKFNQVRGPYALSGPAGCGPTASAHRRFNRNLDRADYLFREGVLRPMRLARTAAQRRSASRALETSRLLGAAIAAVKGDDNYADLSDAAAKLKSSLDKLAAKLRAGTATGADVAAANRALKALRKARLAPPGGIYS